jgi:hypothetical protein
MVVGMGGAWWLGVACFRGCGWDVVGGIAWCWWLWRVEERLRESHGGGAGWCMVLGSGLLSR